MGSKMGPNYACLFVGYIEEQIARQYTGFVPQLHKRYIDDVLGVACCSRLELDNYINFVSNFHPALQFTHTISASDIPSWTLIFALQMIASARLFTKRSQTRRAIFTNNLRIPGTARMVSPVVNSLDFGVCALTTPIFWRKARK